MSLGKISLELRAVVGKFVADLSTATKSIDGLEAKMQKIGNAGGTFAAGFAVIGGLAVKAASDFEQTGNLIERAFGVDGARAIETFASSMSSDLGTSLQETRQGLVSIGMQLKNSLGDPTAAQEQAKAITKLAADISAAMNIPFAETLERIQSGLRGETEAIEKLNIFIGESSLKQEALNKGMRQSVETMSEAQKTALRLSAIFKQTADIQGAAAAESETFAGQLARLDGDVKNLGVELGTILLPAALELVRAARALVSVFTVLSPETKKVAVGIAAVAAASGGALFAVSSFAGVLGTVAPFARAAVVALAPVAAAVKAAITAFVFGSGSAGVAAFSFGTIAANTGTLLATLAKAFAPVAAAAATLTVAYGATTAVMAAAGFDTVPENVSVLGELAEAFGEATRSAKGFKSVMVNILGVLTLDGRALGMSNGGLTEWFREGAEAEVVAEMLADAFNELTDEEKAFIDGNAAAAGGIAETDAALTALGFPLAGTNEALEWNKKKNDAATKAAKAYSEAIKDQRDHVRKLEDAFAELADVTGVESIVSKAQSDRTQAFALAQKTGGPEAKLELDAAMSLIGDTLQLELTTLLENIDTARFAEAMEKANIAIAGFSESISSEKLKSRIENGGKTDAEVQTDRESRGAARRAFVGTEKELDNALAEFTSAMPGLASVVDGTKDSFDRIIESARAGRISNERAQVVMEKQKAVTSEVIGGMLRQAATTGDLDDAMVEARKAAADLGISFDDVVKAMKRQRRFSEVQGTLGNNLGDILARVLFDAFSDLAGSQELGKGLAEMFGGALNNVLSGGGIDGAGIGSLAGGALGAAVGLPPAAGAQIGSLIGKAVEVALVPVTAGLAAAASSLTDLVSTDPRGGAIIDEIGQLLSSAPLVAGLFGAFAPAMLTFAAMIATVGVLVRETEGYAQAQAIVSDSMSGLVAIVEPLGDQFAVLAVLFSQIVTMLTPFIAVFGEGEAVGKALFEMMKQLTRVVGLLALGGANAVNTFAAMASGMLNATGYIVDGIARFLDFLDFAGVADEQVKAAQSLRNALWAAADAAEQVGSIDTDAIQKGMDAVAATTWESAQRTARADAIRRRAEQDGEAEDVVAKARERLAASLNNITSDFKIAYQRFSAADAVVPGRAGGVGSAFDARAAASTVINIANMNMATDNPATFIERLQRVSDRRDLSRIGSRRSNQSSGNGRNES